jgi:Tfp pilus assembly protein PilF
MVKEPKKQRALELWAEGQERHLAGRIGDAIELYTQSIEICPTAEAHTFRGWAYSFQGATDEAIKECKRAIDVDPTFGNPYNDIGSYLISLDRAEEAIEWFEEAKKAPRYEPRHFPYMNLGRVYVQMGMLLRALEQFEGALELCPDEPTCLAAVDELRRSLN